MNDSTNAPIFVLCCERSGSSLLRYILDTHSAIAAPAELNLGRLCRSLYWTTKHTISNVPHAAHSAQRDAREEVRSIIDKLMNQYVLERGRQIWCEKSPQNIDHIEVLFHVFPDARYICLHRHGLDVLHSLLDITRYSYMPDQVDAVVRHSGNIVGAMLETWVRKTKALLAFEAAHPEQCYQLHYEAYVTAPEQVLPPLFAFLGLEWEADLIDSVFTTPHDKGFEDARVAFSTRIHTASVGKGRDINPQLIPPAIRDEVNALLVQLKYAPIGADWEIQHPSVEDVPQTKGKTEISDVVLSNRLAQMAQISHQLVQAQG